ncbi:protein suppressor of white apricot isoform X1 [Drosophila suzukii]|uniref:Protein suppressor of white apricot isoform X1 n=1 Tax=Drosophila suzukii TaxID=28584 RepID=A0AB39ZJT1_DROSZ|nr:protein suppressor of white apricot isoform X1 [Drosophila suzukii]
MMPYNVRNAGGGSVGGILRRTGLGSGSGPGSTALSNGNGTGGAGSSASLENHRQTPLELLVFGYACKIFRDDEKAREMDHGKQLIPWMGDVNLKIDRYDVRGALCELAPHEAPPGGYGNRLEYLSAEEQRAEQLCEEERYLFLYNNEEELRLRQEEDLKRLQQETSGGNYSQVGFQYDGQSAASASLGGSSTAPSQLSPTSEESELPFVLPYTLMLVPPLDMQLPETMKQHAIIEKTARFIATQGAQMEILIKAKQANNAQFDFLTQGGYLQPYYRHLLAAIKAAKFPPAPETTLDQQNPDQESQSTNVNSEDGVGGRRNTNQVITVPTIKYKPSANCAYTQLISKIKGVPLQAVLLEDESSNPGNSQHSGTASPTPSCRSEGHNSQGGEFTPVLLQYNGSTFTHEAEATVQEQQDENSREPPQVELLKNTSALALAQNYSSESEEEEDPAQPEKEPERKPEPVLTFPVPEESLRHIIDKTATYVIKNGRQFEETLRTKSVERFSFLLPANEFYAYYLYKVTGDVDAASKEEKTRKAAAVAAALMSKKGLSFGGAAAAVTGNNLDKAPVSFSIRARDEHGPLQPTLPQEASDEETSSIAGAEQVRPVMPDSVQRAIKQVETQLLARTAGQKAGGSSTASPSSSSPQKEQRQAEERVKDKLAQIAREKLNGMISREKQLQLERKRKAMAFLNQIKGEGATVGSAVPEAAPNPPEPAAGASQTTAPESDDESNESVRSIPITYFGPDDDDEVGDQKPEVRLEKETQEDEEDDEDEDGGDLEKYNLLNDDSTNTFTSKPVRPLVAPPPPAVLLSDDDDVQLVATTTSRSSSSRPRKTSRRSRSRSRNGRSSPSSASSRESPHRRRQRSSKLSKEPSSTPARKYQQQSTRRKSPKKRRRSKSRSRSRSVRRSRSISRANRRSRSRSYSGSRDTEQRRQQQRRRTPTKKTHKRHKRRRRSSSP